MRSFSTLIEVIFFKKRNVVIYPQLHNNNESVIALPLVSSREVFLKSSIFNDERLNRFLSSRNGDNSWVAFLLIRDDIVYGYSFLHTPDKVEWLDALPTYADEARECSTFVFPEFRGQGVRSSLLCAQSTYAAGQQRQMWAVIESRNKASMHSSLLVGGKVERRNYLIKFFGRNVISVLTNPFSLLLLVGKRRANR